MREFFVIPARIIVVVIVPHELIAIMQSVVITDRTGSNNSGVEVYPRNGQNKI